MSSSRVLFALWLGVIPALGAELGLIQSTASRQGISLNGQWRVIVDPYESGYFDYRYNTLLYTKADVLKVRGSRDSKKPARR